MTTPIEYASVSTAPSKPSKAAFITGWILSAIPALFLGSAVIMMFMPKMVIDGATQQGFANPTRTAWVLLTLEVVCAVLYLIPRTAVLGAILMTGYLGGAIATHLRLGEIPQMTPAIVLGIMVWLGLFLRDLRVRALVPLRHV